MSRAPTLSRRQRRLRHTRFYGLLCLLCLFVCACLFFGGALAHDAGDRTLGLWCWSGTAGAFFAALCCYIIGTEMLPE